VDNLIKDAIKPRVIISKCIEFDNCRYNGQIINSDQVKELKPHVEFIPICPEVEVGLGIPRDPIRIVYTNSDYQLLQPKTGKNITKDMKIFAASYLNSQTDIDGFILKTRSPSCGLKEVKVYPGAAKVAPVAKKAGFFGQSVLEHFPLSAIEDEGRLRNPTIREHFLRKIFLFAQFRSVKNMNHRSSLIKFHTENKFLLMAYNQTKLKELGRLVADEKRLPLAKMLSQYDKMLHEIVKRPPRCTSNINILQHSFGYISDGLSKEERKFFLNQLEQYRQAKLSLASVINILKSWIIRFDEPYLKIQTFFSPYPEQLIHAENIDSCSSRNYWQ
jgi:uncharacterized protein YbgA (DUF1722 family)/uncharacterized protein YbbK (DUF523 family)